MSRIQRVSEVWKESGSGCFRKGRDQVLGSCREITLKRWLIDGCFVQETCNSHRGAARVRQIEVVGK
jgi:hypothetical protein